MLSLSPQGSALRESDIENLCQDAVSLEDGFWNVVRVVWDIDRYRSSGMPVLVVEVAGQWTAAEYFGFLNKRSREHV